MYAVISKVITARRESGLIYKLVGWRGKETK